MTEPITIKVAPTSRVAAWLAAAEADLEWLRGALVERGQYAEDLRELEALARVLADKADTAVADAKRNIQELENLRNLVQSGQAKPDSEHEVAVRSMGIRMLDHRLPDRLKPKAKKS